MKTERLRTAECQQRLCSHFSCHFDRHATRTRARSKGELQSGDPRVHGRDGKWTINQGVVLLVLFLDADETITENGALGAAGFF